MIKRAVSTILILIAPLSYATEEKGADSNEVVCTKDTEKRIFTINYEGTGCKLIYKKNDEKPNEIASQKIIEKDKQNICDTTIVKIKEKLVGFQCN